LILTADSVRSHKKYSSFSSAVGAAGMSSNYTSAVDGFEIRPKSGVRQGAFTGERIIVAVTRILSGTERIGNDQQA
jgi:hypothetical protein